MLLYSDHYQLQTKRLNIINDTWVWRKRRMLILDAIYDVIYYYYYSIWDGSE